MNPKRTRAECIGYRPDPDFVPFPLEEIERTIPDRFRKQVEKYPDRLAVKTEGLTLTYGELNGAANRLAHAILKSIGSSQHRVGVLLEQGADLIVAILGVLKSGQVYVPLDPVAPLDRLRSIVEDSGLGLIVTNTRNTKLAWQLSDATDKPLNMDEIDSALSHGDPNIWGSPESLATILYTSGSTGKPKGVIADHRIWLAYLRNRIQVSNLSTNERFTLFSYPGFSGAFTDICDALLNGAALILRDVRAKGVAGLATFLIDECITVYHSVSTVYRQLMATLSGTEKFPALREIMLSGEPISRQDLETFKNHFSRDSVLCTRMGTTETMTVFTGFVEHAIRPEAFGHLLGYPLESQYVVLLAEDGREMGSGEVGEIVVESAHLAYGYHKEPDLTAERFLPSSKGEGRRAYFTGDLARESGDRLFEHKGRKDFQANVRGQRVELGEIETILLQQRGLKEAVVAVRKDRSGNPLLIAYVVSEGGDLPTASFLRAMLAEKLPQYMVPHLFVWLDSLPMTASGKVDRKALPHPDETQLDLQRGYVTPRTPIEEELAQVWQKVLAQERVGINDNFFELGGHSLLATQAISRVNETFNVSVPLRNLFEAPTVAELAGKVAVALSRERLAQAPPLEPVPRDGDLPLSFAQQRLWFLDQLAPESWGYHVPYYLRSKGRLRVAVLEACLKEIVERHESLRTTFIDRGGVPVQVIAPRSPRVLSEVDLRELSEGKGEALVEKLIGEELHRPFDLSRGPLLRVMLVRVAEEEHVWLITMHHIVSDGWSMGVFVRELMALYEAFLQGKSSPLPELPIQYPDFSVWQRAWFRGEVRQGQLSYWKGELAGAPAVLGLPTDRQRPALQTFEGGWRTVVFPRELYGSLEELSQGHNATLFMSLLAAFQVLLHRYTGQEDFVVGSPIANRNRSEIEGLIGFFVNMMCLRANVSGDPSFRELLARVRERSLQAYANQDLPFEQLVEELGVERDLSRTPVFQVAFALQNAPRSALELPGLSLTPVRSKKVSVRYDLEWQLWERAEGLTANVTYNTDLFDAGTMERMLGHYRVLLEGIVSSPEERVSRLPLLSEEERRRLLLEWNDTGREYPKDRCIHELFEEQVERTPEAIAVLFRDEQITYWEIDTRANQLAHHLRGSGVGPEVPVGIMVGRSLGMVVGILGILKAGGACVPLDPSCPTERLAFIVEDAGISFFVMESDRQQAIGYREQRQLGVGTRIFLDDPAIARQPGTKPQRTISPENLAYVIYTSGSTGRPKGAGVNHGSFVNLLDWFINAFGIGTEDRSFVISSLSSDLTLKNLFTPLLVGGVVELGPEPYDPRRILDAIWAGGATWLNCTPNAFTPLIELPEPSAFELKSLKHILLGGEAMPLRKLLPWLLSGDCRARILNSYGPTECTDISSMFVLNQPTDFLERPVPIGTPIQNTGLFVLDAGWRLEPVGVVGELCISHIPVGRGYINDPRTSAEKFSPNPYGAEPGMRLYRSGDLARWLHDGNIEFSGRMDHQVKVRGFRIELGEIEGVLSQHPAVQEAVVVVRDLGTDGTPPTIGEKRLVGYVVPEQGVSPGVSELRAFLGKKLPNYMIPSAFVVLESLPLTLSGKVDRKALLATDPGRSELEGVYVPARTSTEELLVSIWEEVLGVEGVGIHDNFFELGGHSLLATQVISRVDAAFRVPIPLRDLFEAPTVAGLAQLIQTMRWVDTAGPGLGPTDDDTEEVTF